MKKKIIGALLVSSLVLGVSANAASSRWSLLLPSTPNSTPYGDTIKYTVTADKKVSARTTSQTLTQ